MLSLGSGSRWSFNDHLIVASRWLARSLLLNVARSLQFIPQSRLKPIAQYRVTVLAVCESPGQILEHRWRFWVFADHRTNSFELGPVQARVGEETLGISCGGADDELTAHTVADRAHRSVAYRLAAADEVEQCGAVSDHCRIRQVPRRRENLRLARGVKFGQ